MIFDPREHHRRSIRLSGYDYSRPGAYFVTICTQGRTCLFGAVVDGVLRLNDAGRMVLAEWGGLSQRFPNIMLDEFIIMPNHVHGIIIIPPPAPHGATVRASVGATLVVAPDAPNAPDGATTRVAPTIGDMIGAFKSRVTVEYARHVKTHEWPPFRDRLWQRNYYEHIIRNHESLCRIRQYIANNPAQWAHDRDNSHAAAPELGDT